MEWNVERLLKEAEEIRIDADLSTPESFHEYQAHFLLTHQKQKWFLSGMPLSSDNSLTFEVDNIAQFLLYLCANIFPSHVHLVHVNEVPESQKGDSSSPEVKKSRVCLFISSAKFTVTKTSGN